MIIMRFFMRPIYGVFLGAMFVLVPIIASNTVQAQALIGEIGFSPIWNSGWLDLARPVDFAKGERLKLHIGGTAKKVLIRFLPIGGSPDTDVGVVGGVITVPKSRIVEITLPQDHRRIIQISVHGGPKPWGKISLGKGSGMVTIKSVQRIKP